MMSERRNAVLIMADHQLYYNGAVKRPYFDAFCQRGKLFENAVCVAPLCCPARRSVLNGTYPHLHGQYDNFRSVGLGEQTYFDVLRDMGYENYYFGKWHAGSGRPADLGIKGFSPESYNNPYKHAEYENYCKKYGLPYLP